MTVLELLDEMEEMVKAAPKLPITSKIMLDYNELLELAEDIRESLPDDIQQAKWIKEEKENILSSARKEYDKIILGAKNQADMLVKENIITSRATEVAGEIYKRSDEYSKSMRLRTYMYMDDVLGEFKNKVEELNTKYFAALYDDMNHHFETILSKVEGDLYELQELTSETQNEEVKEHEIEIPVGDDEDEA